MIEIIILFIILYYVVNMYSHVSLDNTVKKCNDIIISNSYEYEKNNINETLLKNIINDEVRKIYAAFRDAYSKGYVVITDIDDINKYLTDNMQKIGSEFPIDLLNVIIDAHLNILLIEHNDNLNAIIEEMKMSEYIGTDTSAPVPISDDMKNSILSIIKTASNKVVQKITTDGTFAPKAGTNDSYLTKLTYAGILNDVYAPKVASNDTAGTTGYLTASNYSNTIADKYVKSSDTNYLTKTNYANTFKSDIATNTNAGVRNTLDLLYAPKIIDVDDGYLTKKNYTTTLDGKYMKSDELSTKLSTYTTDLLSNIKTYTDELTLFTNKI